MMDIDIRSAGYGMDVCVSETEQRRPRTDRPAVLGRPATVSVDEAAVRYWTTGPSEGDEILLVHGASANAMWWHRVVPSLAARHRVVMVDLSGHGQSDHRAAYSTDQWVRDVRGVVDAACRGRPFYVGHSLGGRVGTRFAAEHPDAVSGLMAIESIFRPAHRMNDLAPLIERPMRFAVSSAEQMRRFRLVPAQEPLNDADVAPAAQYAMTRTDRGWRWRYDPAAVLAFDDPSVDRQLDDVSVPSFLVWGECSSLIDAELRDFARDQLPNARVQLVAGGTHHLVLSHGPQIATAIMSAVSRCAA